MQFIEIGNAHEALGSTRNPSIRLELRELLGVPVDVVTPNALPEKFRQAVILEARPV